MDGKLLAAARKQLDTIRHRNEDQQSARQREIYEKFPRILQIDQTLHGQMRQLGSLVLEKDGGERLRQLEEENLRLQAQRRAILTAAGYPADYTDDHYDCPDCRDTGFVGGKMCHCLRTLYNAEVTRNLSKLLRGDEHFGKFDPHCYSDRPNEHGESPRELMIMNREICSRYAQRFSTASPNMVFSGAPGLGKTFLSACIARTVSERGFSVAYDSATAALGAFEREKFSRDPDETAEAANTVKHYLNCDLMILDDLGTEMNTAFTQSALYTLINQRLTAGLPMIISTNLTESDLSDRYTPQITSRLLGEYQWLHFVGTDIRRLKERYP